MLRPSLWFVTGQTLYVTTKFMICYCSERCMLWPSLWFVTGQNAVCYDQVYDLLLVRTLLRPSLWFVIGQNAVCYNQVYDLLLVKTLCYHQVYDLLLVRTLYVKTKFMICYWLERCMLRPSLWFVTGLRTLYVTTKFMICYWSENTVCYDQVYDLLLVWMPYVTISNSYI